MYEKWLKQLRLLSESMLSLTADDYNRIKPIRDEMEQIWLEYVDVVHLPDAPVAPVNKEV